MNADNENVLLRPVGESLIGGTLVGQIGTVKETFAMMHRSTNPGIDPNLSVLTAQNWLTEPVGLNYKTGTARTAVRELAHEMAMRRYAESRF